MAKPEWCKSIECPYSRGSDYCEINEWIRRGWPPSHKDALKKRRKIGQEYSILAQEDPKALMQECVDKSFDKR